jgi:hypothetical protein
LILETNLATGRTSEVTPFTTNQLDYRSELNLNSAELLQIFQRRQHTLIAGARFQHGEFETQSRSAIPLFIAPTPPWPDRDLVLELNKIVIKACHPDVAKRYACAALMGEELQRLRRET